MALFVWLNFTNWLSRKFYPNVPGYVEKSDCFLLRNARSEYRFSLEFSFRLSGDVPINLHSSGNVFYFARPNVCAITIKEARYHCTEYVELYKSMIYVLSLKSFIL